MKRVLWLTVVAGLMSVSGCKIVASGTYHDCDPNISGVCDVGDECDYVSVPGAGTMGGFCSHPCDSNTDCEPAFGVQGGCYSLPPDQTQLCYQRCPSTGDCFVGMKCAEVAEVDPTTGQPTGVVASICLPNNGIVRK